MKKIILISLILSQLIFFNIFGEESGFASLKDAVIHYKTYGSGYPVLIINGGPGMNCEGFAALAELLMDKYQAIIYDQRGTGKSDLRQVDSTTVTMDLMADDIEALRHYLKIKEWIILGHSFGGWLAQHYATKYPEPIKGMILSGSGGIDLEVLDYFGANIQTRLGQCEKDSLAYWRDRIKQGDTSYYAKYQRAKALAPVYLYHQEYVPQIATRLTQGIPEITSLVYKDLHKINYNTKESLQDFAKPVLIIQGRQDIIGSGTAHKAHMVYPNSSLIFINKCGHYGWIDQEEAYITEVTSFIESID